MSRIPHKLSDGIELDSANRMIHSLFHSESGAHRGLANTAGPTALAEVVVSADFQVGIDAYLNLMLDPANFYYGNWLVYGEDANVVNPLTIVGRQYMSTPFNTAPTNAAFDQARVAHCSIKLTNVSPAVFIGGNYGGAYIPKLCIGNPVLTTDILFSPWTRTNIEQQTYFRSIPGTETALYQWAPNTDEYDCEDIPVATNERVYSGFAVYYHNSSTTNSQIIRLEAKLIVEYAPTQGYLALVEKQTPVGYPTTPYWVNQFLKAHWNKCMITSFKEYLEASAQTTALDRVYYPSSTHRGMGQSLGVSFAQNLLVPDTANEVRVMSSKLPTFNKMV